MTNVAKVLLFAIERQAPHLLTEEGRRALTELKAEGYVPLPTEMQRAINYLHTEVRP